MLIALNEKGNRIQPTKGGLGICQTCKNDVRAYCGEIYIHHWKHIDATLCDSWKENETEWHREWKGIFPIDWQEVVVRKNGEEHRADVKTPKGLVVEFQNSSISSFDVKARENFYNNMIWVINAQKFNKNITLWSEVTSQLKRLDREYYSYNHYEHKNYDSPEVEKIKENISDIENELRSIKWKTDSLKSSLNDIKVLRNNLKKTTEDFLQNVYGFYGALKELDPKIKEEFNHLQESKKKLSIQIKEKESLLNRIDQLEKCTIKGYENYSVISFDQIKPKHFKVCKMIKKDTINSLFLEVIDFKSPEDYKRMGRNSNYTLIMNFVSAIKEIINEKSVLEKAITENKIKIKLQKKIVRNAIETILKKEKNAIKSTFKKNKEKKNKWRKKLTKKESNLQNTYRTEEVEKAKSESEVYDYIEKRKVEIMNSYKGLYGYQWKYRRKTWDFATKPIYLDYGNVIFKILDESRLKKISNLDLVNLVSSWSEE